MPQPCVRTIRELAGLLGVSKATVSLALRNHPRIPEETRLHIQSEATRLGYRPNALVGALMAQIRHQKIVPQGEVLAFLTADKDEHGWRNYSVRDCFEAACARARSRGFRLEQFWLGPRGSHSQRIRRVLRARTIRGVVISPLPPEVGPLNLDWDSQLFVTVGASFRQHNLHRCAHHHFNGMMTCYANLWRLGYRRIGLALYKECEDRTNHVWMAGFLAAQCVHEVAPLPMLLLEGAWKRPGDEARFLLWFDAHRPDAIIGIHPDFPLEWLKARHASGLQRVAYASLDLH